MLSLIDGEKALGKLIEEINKENHDWNEAETRFKYIDCLLTECLGWPKTEITVEHHQDGEYTDYELGQPRTAIWEAKREGVHFEFPANPSKNIIQNLASVLQTSPSLKKAINQVLNYCNSRGTPIAVVCNGPQLIAFLANRIDGIPPLEGRCLIVNDHDSLQKEFPLIWQSLSRDGILERYLINILTRGIESTIPKSPSDYLIDYPKYRYKSDIREGLYTVAELLIEDIETIPEIQKEFLEECYCTEGSLSRDALLSRSILTARYDSLFKPNEPAPTLTPATNKKGEIVITEEIIAQAITQKPILLLGDVGVGKTTFLNHLKLITARDEFGKALYIQIDLGSNAAFEKNLIDFTLGEIERQLINKYDVDITESSFVRGVYNIEVQRFRSSIYGDLYESDKAEYDKELRKMLSKKLDNTTEHLRRSVCHISKGRKKQIIIVVDNADQRPLEIQQEAFVIANNFSKNWDSVVFISIRPQTFFHSKQAGTLSAYPQRIFTISPPRADLVIEKRLQFALKMAKGEIPVAKFQDLHLDFETLALFLASLIYSLKNNKEISVLLSNITGGNIRAVVEFVKKFIGSPNVEAEKIVSIMKKTGRYLIPLHEFSKAAILGDYQHFHADSSLAMNIFEVKFPDEKEHFLVPFILAYLNFDGSHRGESGFVKTTDILKEMQNYGYIPQQIEDAIRRTSNKKLIETSERVTFKEDITGLIGSIPQYLRITTIGAYHIRKWAPAFSYLDAMLFNTAIFDKNALEEMTSTSEKILTIQRFDINIRYQRTVVFRKYLTTVWNEIHLQPKYFDWNQLVPSGQPDFDRVLGAFTPQSA